MQVWAAAHAHGGARYEQVVMQGNAGMGCSSDLRTSAGGDTSLLGRQLLSLLCQAHHLACTPPTYAMYTESVKRKGKTMPFSINN